MKASRSEFLTVRDLTVHCRIWDAVAPTAPTLFCLHGWMDVSASFQFLVDALEDHSQGSLRIIAPDWRGFGRSDWTSAATYWFPDYLADLDVILKHYSSNAPVHLLGHSMGGNIACLYAGARPDRIARLINIEGFGMDATDPTVAPSRYARWMDEQATGTNLRDYDSFEALAKRLRQNNPRLTEERAKFLAQHWGEEENARIVLRADPRHKIVNPVLYRIEEARACWRSITAPVLWIVGGKTRAMRFDEAEHAARKACFGNLTQRVIPDAGHMLHHDQPAELARIIESWLAKTPVPV